MDIADILTPDCIVPGLRVSNKRQMLHELARRAGGLADLPERRILEILQEREKLGSTGVGAGVAIPHGKMLELSRIVALFVRLERPVDFHAIDGQPVDLIFLLLTPSEQSAGHLRTLAQVSRLLRRRDICSKLRGTESRAALFALLTERQVSDAA